MVDAARIELATPAMSTLGLKHFSADSRRSPENAPANRHGTNRHFEAVAPEMHRSRKVRQCPCPLSSSAPYFGSMTATQCAAKASNDLHAFTRSTLRKCRVRVDLAAPALQAIQMPAGTTWSAWSRARQFSAVFSTSTIIVGRSSNVWQAVGTFPARRWQLALLSNAMAGFTVAERCQQTPPCANQLYSKDSGNHQLPEDGKRKETGPVHRNHIRKSADRHTDRAVRQVQACMADHERH